MFLRDKLANPAIATKCKQNSLGLNEVQVELGGKLSPVTTREIHSFKGNKTRQLEVALTNTRDALDRVVRSFP